MSDDTTTLQLLTATDRRRVQIYFRLVDTMRDVEGAVREWAEAGEHPEITDEQRAASEAAVREALEGLNIDAEAQKRLPTKDMLHAYALEEIFAQLGQLRTEVRDLAETVERGL